MDMAHVAPNDTHRSANSSSENMDKSYMSLLKSISPPDPVLLIDREQDIVNLFDQLSELRLENALIQAQQTSGIAEGYRA